MKLLIQKTERAEEGPAEEIAWQPEVLHGPALPEDIPADLDLEEVWYWLHSRLRALGEMSRDDARLTALLNWNGVTVSDALHAARLHINQMDEEGEARQAHLEFLTADFLARQALEKEPIPTRELRPA
ncbi:MAG: hypothetical protein V2I48_12390 [Xanthomonadales bacterium]|jgi:hypothetical protein|nr:hypothetical protein [Xanthomonadales bacterium]